MNILVNFKNQFLKPTKNQETKFIANPMAINILNDLKFKFYTYHLHN